MSIQNNSVVANGVVKSTKTDSLLAANNVGITYRILRDKNNPLINDHWDSFCEGARLAISGTILSFNEMEVEILPSLITNNAMAIDIVCNVTHDSRLFESGSWVTKAACTPPGASETLYGDIFHKEGTPSFKKGRLLQVKGNYTIKKKTVEGVLYHNFSIFANWLGTPAKEFDYESPSDTETSGTANLDNIINTAF